ncbi:thioredoxin family protein [Maricaulis sp.]|uniref:DUF1223 domain-containing protein n=1 Tax=Maricaulis sp. TaxID=1486257 RepID=UPI002618C0BB|nr:DUF1223 domain-containing protein [Maricaulis sp.]
MYAALVLALMLVMPSAATAGTASCDEPTETRPVLVELFTSQGCGLCPDANRYLGELDQRENVFVLAFGVSYWDMYGWTDTYARPEYVTRQRAYLPRLGINRLYTPQFVVDGAINAPGWNEDKVADAVEQRLTAMPYTPEISISDGPFGSFVVNIDGEAPEEPLDVWLVSYAPGWATVDIEAGENAGTEMLHYNMVKSLTHIGRWDGGSAEFAGESYRSLKTMAIVQGADGGPVYGFAFAEDAETN